MYTHFMIILGIQPVIDISYIKVRGIKNDFSILSSRESIGYYLYLFLP